MDRNDDLEKLMQEIRRSQSRGKKLPDPGKLIDEIRKSQSGGRPGEGSNYETSSDAAPEEQTSNIEHRVGPPTNQTSQGSSAPLPPSQNVYQPPYIAENDLVGIITYGPCAKATRVEGYDIPDVVMTIPRRSGIYRQCTVADYAQNTDKKGFARLKYQIFHGPILEKLGCPFYHSRSILYRITVISWLFVKTEICPFADGKEQLKST